MKMALARTTLTLALTAASIALPVGAQQPIMAIGDVQRGEALVGRWCMDCHHLSGQDSETDQAPSIQWIARKTQKDPAYIRTFLSHPHTPMPPLDLNRAQIENVIAYFQARAKG